MATWPTANSFPQKPASGSFTGGPQNNVIAFEPELGDNITRRRGSAVAHRYSARFTSLTLTQLNTFVTFFETTLSDGNDSFTWDDPIYGDTGTWRIAAGDPPYTITEIAPSIYDISMTMIKVPS